MISPDEISERQGFDRHERAMTNDRLLQVGIIGTVVAALCCFTPILAIALGAVGLSAALVWLDVVLVPVLLVFLGVTGFASWRRRSQ